MPLHTDYMYSTTTTLGCTQLCAKQRNDGNYCYRIRNAICDFTWETQIEEGQKRIPLVTTATTQYTLPIAGILLWKLQEMKLLLLLSSIALCETLVKIFVIYCTVMYVIQVKTDNSN